MKDIIFSIDTSRFSSLAFSDSGSDRSIDQYTELSLSRGERLLFQIMADPNLKGTLFNAGSVLIQEGELVEIAHVVVSGTVKVIHSDGSFLVGPGAVIGLSEGLLGIKSSSTVQAETPVNTRMIPIIEGTRAITFTNSGIKNILRSLVARTLHIKVLPWSLR